MRRSMAGLVGLTVCAVALPILGAKTLAVMAAATILGVGAWHVLRCHHPGPLGLLPPVFNADGSRTAAQWFCDKCGRSWPAAIEREQRTVRRFEGYDQSKAIGAARRAEDLRKRQQSLALRRAGLGPHRRPRLRPDAAEVVPIAQVRRAK